MSVLEGQSGLPSYAAGLLSLTHTGRRPLGNGASGRVPNSGHPPSADIGRSFGGSDASRVGISVRGDVVDLATRNPDIH